MEQSLPQLILPIKLERSLERLTSLGGLVVLEELARAVGLWEEVDGTLEGAKSGRGYRPREFVQALVWMLHAGGRRLEDLREWGAEQEVLGELGLEAVPDAVDAIISVAHHDPSTHVRGQALFWLAQKPGKRAAATITEAIENDPETDVKKHAVFALSQLPKDEGVPLLIQVARRSGNAVVRKQAMFWLGQSHDPRALAFFEQILSH